MIKGRVLIFRNPCLHPGDLRLVEAVSVPELSDYKNVVIFPAHESCRTSLPDECSGGDLVRICSYWFRLHCCARGSELLVRESSTETQE